MTESKSRFPTPALDTLPDDIRTRIEEVSEKSGFVPNVFTALAHRPDEFRAFFSYHDALMEKESGLTKGEREMIATKIMKSSTTMDSPQKISGTSVPLLRFLLCQIGWQVLWICCLMMSFML